MSKQASSSSTESERDLNIRATTSWSMSAEPLISSRLYPAGRLLPPLLRYRLILPPKKRGLM